MEEKSVQLILQVLNNMNKEFILFRQEIKQKFEEIDKRFERIEQKLQELKEGQRKLEERQKQLEEVQMQLKEGQIQLKKQRDIDAQNLSKILEEQTKIKILLEEHINEPFEIAHRKTAKITVM